MLDAVLELFWKNGYRVTTTRELEESLGLTASSIYNAFGSKEDLLLTAMERYERQITDELLGPLETSSDGLESIEAFFRALSQWVTHDGRRGCMLVNMMAEDGGSKGPVAERARRYRARLRAAFSSALERAADADEMAREDAETRADLLLCQVFGLNIAARGGAPTADLKRLATSIRSQIESWKKER